MTAPLAGVRRRSMARWAPPPRLTVSQFADKELVVAVGPLSGTRWKTDLAPYQRGIMDAFHEPGVEVVAVRGSSQWGKTACACNLVAYHIAHDPCPILVVEPTVDPMANDFSKNRLAPLIESSPALKEKIKEPRSKKDATNNILLKTFASGFLAIGGANSAASLASRSVRVLVLDEIDRYPAELAGEGSTIEIALKRTLVYRGRRRVFIISSPTIEDGPIDAWFKQGDQRRFYVPCPSCSHMHVLQWANVRFTDHDPDTAHFVCPACKESFGDRDRVEILRHGEWRADKPTRGIASFHMWEGYSPFSSLAEIVRGFLRAKLARTRGDRSAMHTWINTTLGEPVQIDDGEGVEPNVLLLRREEYVAVRAGEPRKIAVPAGGCCLTLGVDVQDDRLEGLVIGWGPGEESWIVDRVTLPGDTSQPGPWAMLDELLDMTYEHASGARLHVLATCIDSGGHRTTMVYDYAHRQAARRVYATIGRDGERPIVSSPSPRRWGRTERQVPLYTIGVDAAKALVMSRLKLTEKGPGFVHLPADHPFIDEEFVAQLTSERLVTRWHKGIPTTQWVKTRARNEALDAAVLSLAALRLLNPNLTAVAARLSQIVATAAEQASPGAPAPPVPPAARPRRFVRSSYLSGG